MEKIIELLISLIAGAIAGGVTSYKISQKFVNSMRSKEKNSPNIGGNVTKSNFGDK